MGKQTTSGSQTSRIVWENPEEWIRRKVQEFIQSLLEEEITELLEPKKSERRKVVDSLRFMGRAMESRANWPQAAGKTTQKVQLKAKQQL
jgi:hypothetical protein